MGLTSRSSGLAVLQNTGQLARRSDQLVVALAGNPNTGKSTVFNALTGLNQHTGNWPGKTVAQAHGTYTYRNRSFLLVDLPGTYSLLASSVEEQIARDYLCFNRPDATVVVVDATCLERNLNLVLQVMEITNKVVVCVNLIDEARRKGVLINREALAEELGIPVVLTTARSGEGLKELRAVVLGVAEGTVTPRPRLVRYRADVESAVSALEQAIATGVDNLSPRWVALRLLDHDEALLSSLLGSSPEGAALQALSQEVRERWA
ncbi:MAG: FeoB small GTPase domain-containing protein [Chitinophagales bacterium]